MVTSPSFHAGKDFDYFNIRLIRLLLGEYWSTHGEGTGGSLGVRVSLSTTAKGGSACLRSVVQPVPQSTR